jgi:hypothetical protein
MGHGRGDTEQADRERGSCSIEVLHDGLRIRDRWIEIA